MPIIEGAQRRGMAGVATFTYSFAAQGGAVGNITLPGDGAIPAGATILGGYIDVTTALTSGGAATAALNAETAGDLQAAAAVSGAPWSTTGRKNVVPAFSGATSIRTTAARSVVLAIATAALTAGAFSVVVFYQVP